MAHGEMSVQWRAGCTERGRAGSDPHLGLTSGGFVLDGLLEEGDVPEGAEEEDHLVVFIPYRGDLHVKPDGGSCRRQLGDRTSFEPQRLNIVQHQNRTGDTHGSWCRAAPRRTGTRSR